MVWFSGSNIGFIIDRLWSKPSPTSLCILDGGLHEMSIMMISVAPDYGETVMMILLVASDRGETVMTMSAEL